MSGRGHKSLTPEQVREATELKEQLGFTKRRLALYFSVSSTTIYYNVYTERKATHRQMVMENRNRPRCFMCEIFLRTDFPDGKIPLNYQIGNHCLTCYLREKGLEYNDII